MPIVFFTGGLESSQDEIGLDCPDDYHSLPLKTKAICDWASRQEIEYLFICDTDTFVIPSKLLSCGFENYDYVGKIDRPLGQTFAYTAIDRDGVKTFNPKSYPWASGGYGYFLSRKAFEIVANVTVIGWAEDMIVGNLLGPRYESGEIKMLNIPGGTISEHFPSHFFHQGYDNNLGFAWMREMQASRGKS